MDTNNWRPNQGPEPNMDNSDWRGQLQPESRQRIVNKIMDTLKRHLPVSGQEGLHELRKIAQRFEEKIFTAATSQCDYLRKISLKMLTMETKSQGTMASNIPSNQVGPSNKPPDPGLVMQPQVHNPAHQHPMPLPNQPWPLQQLLSQNIQNNIASQPNLPLVSSLAQTPIQNVGQNSNVQNIPGQNSLGGTIGQNSNMQNVFASSQRQMPGRQQAVPQQQQQQSQNQPQLLKHKLLQSQMQQQQQQNLLQPNQLQSSQQPVMQTSSVMQPSIMQTPALSGIQHNQQSNNVQQSTQPMLQQHPQIIRQQQPQQTSIIHQLQTPMTQQSMLPQQQQQQQQIMGSQTNATNMQHAQMLGQQNNVGDMQQSQRLLAQQNNLSNLHQQQLINQQNNLSNIHQQLGTNVPGLQQQQVLGPQSGNSGMQTSQHCVLQQLKVPMQQQSQQNASNLLPSQTQQSQPQPLAFPSPWIALPFWLLAFILLQSKVNFNCMDADNWRPNQGPEPNVDNSDWRGELQPESRQRIVNKIRDELMGYQCFGDVDGLLELKKIAQSVEEKAYAGATSQSDYLEKITLAMQLIDTCDWRVQLHPDSRQRIVNKIVDTLKRHLPVSSEEGLHELRKSAQTFEEKIFTAATSQSDYLRKISLKMLTMETKSQGDHGQPSNQLTINLPMQLI